MYEVSDGRPRGASSSPSSSSHSGRELPILFHLADVSRPRAKPPEKPMGEPAHILAAVESLRPPVEPEMPAVPLLAAVAPAEELLIPPPAKLEVVSSPVAPAVVAEEPVVLLPPTVNTPVTPEIFETTLPAEMSKASDTSKADENTISAQSKAVEPSPQKKDSKKDAVVHPVNLRKKPKTSSSEDWFASHGKFIAIAFVLALIATVYFARANREKAVAKAEPAPQSPLIETIPQAKSSGEQNLWPESMTNNHKTPDAGNALVQTASATESKVELFAPQLVSEAAGEKKKDNLFEFVAAKSDERVAARGDETAKAGASAPALTAPAAAEPATYPVTSPSASRYPVTNPSATAYPATSPPSTSPPALPANAPVAPPPMPPAYPGPAYQPVPQAGPSNDYRTQYPAAPAPPTQQQAWPPAGYGQQPGSYQPSDNTARGQRNERTGSGTY